MRPLDQPTESGLSVRAEYTQCQKCFVSKTPGAPFFRCGGCKIELYCSKKCQKEAWASHKPKCQINRARMHASNDTNPTLTDAKMKALRAFTSKHRPTICECAVRAFDLGRKPNNAESNVFFITLRERPGATKTELLYEVIDAAVLSFNDFPPELAEELRTMRKILTDSHQSEEYAYDGIFFSMLHDTTHHIRNVVPSSWSKENTYDKPMPYLEMLKKNLNGGILF